MSKTENIPSVSTDDVRKLSKILIETVQQFADITNNEMLINDLETVIDSHFADVDTTGIIEIEDTED